MKIKKPFSCGLGPAFDLVGGRWKSAILWELSVGTRRFGELRNNIKGVTEKMLTQQLRELEEHKLIIRKEYQEKPLRVEYALTSDGAKVNDLMIALSEWGREYSHKIGTADNYADAY